MVSFELYPETCPCLTFSYTVANTASVSIHPFTFVAWHNDRVYFQTSDRTIASLLTVGSKIPAGSGQKLPLPELPVPATQIGTVPGLNIMYLQTSGNHISGYNLDDMTSVPSPV